MSTRTFKAVAAAAVLCCVVLCAGHACGQAQSNIVRAIPENLRDAYVRELASVLEQWNDKTLVLPSKSELQIALRKRLEAVVGTPKYPYENKEWADYKQQMFDKLPSRVTPKKQIRNESALILVLLFLKDEAETGKQMSVRDLKKQLELPLFLVLGSAQSEAETRHSQDIDPEAMYRALLDWWTAIWPFCG